MRIVSGIYKGKTFNPPKNLKARPTTDTAKEGLFNIIGNQFDFDTISVLDLFSGTGSISFEFASRGTQNIHLVELDSMHFQFIKKVQKELNLMQITPIRYDAYKFLKNCKLTFDIIFADPPYSFTGIEKIAQIVFEKNLLKKDGILVIEHSKQTSLEHVERFYEKRMYGNTHFSFFR